MVSPLGLFDLFVDFYAALRARDRDRLMSSD
jgi:hypothetical protein